LKVFITGIEGFVGGHLANHLLTRNYEVSGTVWNENEIPALKESLPSVGLYPADIRYHDVMEQILKSTSPDTIVHLAAQSSGAYSYKNPRLTFEVNVLGTVNLLEAIAQETPDARVVMVCSADVYGKVEEDQIPIRETTPFRPINPYSVSKVTQDFLGIQYYYSHGLNIVRVRSFPHTGPGQNPVFALPSFARQISEIESTEFPKPMSVGDLGVIRDYLDVEDVVKAYALLIEQGEAGDVYNVASGVGHSLRDLLELMLSLSAREIEVVEDPALFRPSDIPILVGDATKFRELTGWRPTVEMKETLRRLLDYWRGKWEVAAED
jgi:GDP-4-dehydro-6-deoxy-D-mannose reductase